VRGGERRREAARRQQTRDTRHKIESVVAITATTLPRGKGNAVAKTAADVAGAVAKLGGLEAGLYCERWVPFARELAVMVVRAKVGAVAGRRLHGFTASRAHGPRTWEFRGVKGVRGVRGC
jgi:hypothetical protein